MTYKIYRILLVGGKEYIGISTDPKRRFLEHEAGIGAIICRKLKPVRILEIIDTGTNKMTLAKVLEDLNVLERMQMIGTENVYGGIYCNEMYRKVSQGWIVQEKERVRNYLADLGKEYGDKFLIPRMFEWKENVPQ